MSQLEKYNNPFDENGNQIYYDVTGFWDAFVKNKDKVLHLFRELAKDENNNVGGWLVTELVFINGMNNITYTGTRKDFESFFMDIIKENYIKKALEVYSIPNDEMGQLILPDGTTEWATGGPRGIINLLGNIGNASLIDSIDKIESQYKQGKYYDSGVIKAAEVARKKIEIRNSYYKETMLTDALYDKYDNLDKGIKYWAYDVLLEETTNPSATISHFRRLLDEERRNPERSSLWEKKLLKDIQKLGGELTPEEKEHFK